MFTRFTNSSNVNIAGLYTGNSALSTTYAITAAASVRGTVGAQHIWHWQHSLADRQINRFIGVMLFSRFIKSFERAFKEFLAGRRLELWRIAEYF
ncbi:MAG: hypothetical protein J6W46_08335 [Spirochaetaceae bacterium]|nr:hypothetical protein [Spirochaetaceae bacterium]